MALSQFRLSQSILLLRVGAVDGLDVVLQAGEALQGETALVARRWVLWTRTQS